MGSTVFRILQTLKKIKPQGSPLGVYISVFKIMWCLTYLYLSWIHLHGRVEHGLKTSVVNQFGTRETAFINRCHIRGFEGTFPDWMSSIYFIICVRQQSTVSAALWREGEEGMQSRNRGLDNTMRKFSTTPKKLDGHAP